MSRMSKWTDACLGYVIPLAISAALGQGGAAGQSAEPEPGWSPALPDEGRTRSVTLEGFVLTPDGSPAEGALVVSSAGGRAITDAAGNYRLEVELPLEATSVQVTAAGQVGANSTSSASVSLVPGSHRIRVDPLA